MQKYYYVIVSAYSRNSVAGLRPVVTFVPDSAIIESAARELAREGGTLEDLAGIRWIEQEDGIYTPDRELTRDECLALSIEKLGDDGRLFEAYENPDEFVTSAERYDLGDDARKLVDYFNS